VKKIKNFQSATKIKCGYLESFVGGQCCLWELKLSDCGQVFNFFFQKKTRDFVNLVSSLVWYMSKEEFCISLPFHKKIKHPLYGGHFRRGDSILPYRSNLYVARKPMICRGLLQPQTRTKSIRLTFLPRDHNRMNSIWFRFRNWLKIMKKDQKLFLVLFSFKLIASRNLCSSSNRDASSISPEIHADFDLGS